MSDSRSKPTLSHKEDITTKNNNLENKGEEIRGGFSLGTPPLMPEKETLYRGTLSNFDKVFNQGFIARGTNLDLKRHAFNPPTYFGDSGYIPTSRSKNVARGFPENLPTGTIETYIYEIHTRSLTIDVETELMTNTQDLKSDEIRLLKYEQERAVLKNIKPCEIKGGWEVAITIIDDGNYDEIRSIQEKFIPNKNYFNNRVTQFWKVGNALGCGLTVVGVGLDSASFYYQYQESKVTNHYDNTYREGVRIAGGWLGAYSVGFAGSRVGVLCGAPIIPPWGAIIGGFAGGIIGSVAGYCGVSTMTTRIFDIRRDHVATEFMSTLLDSVAMSFGTIILPNEAKFNFSSDDCKTDNDFQNKENNLPDLLDENYDDTPSPENDETEESTFDRWIFSNDISHGSRFIQAALKLAQDDVAERKSEKLNDVLPESLLPEKSGEQDGDFQSLPKLEIPRFEMHHDESKVVGANAPTYVPTKLDCSRLRDQIKTLDMTVSSHTNTRSVVFGNGTSSSLLTHSHFSPGISKSSSAGNVDRYSAGKSLNSGNSLSSATGNGNSTGSTSVSNEKGVWIPYIRSSGVRYRDYAEYVNTVTRQHGWVKRKP